MKVIGCIIVGVITSAIGFPVYNFKEGHINWKGVVVCVGGCLLWSFICSMISKSKEN